MNGYKLSFVDVGMQESPVVAVVRGDRGHKPVFEALDLIDYRRALAGYDTVLIKVNFITTKTWDTGATTDPIVVEAIIRKLADLPVKVYVVESDAMITNADKAFEVTGMKDMCRRNGVEWLNLRHLQDKVTLEVPNGEVLKTVTVPRLVTESAVISAAKLKTHVDTTVTLGMKNMFGLLPDKFKGKYHLKDISKVVVDINTVLHPALTVIDGFVGMEGKGPIDGTPVQMNLIIAGTDPVATDATAARIMGFNPYEITHIRKAYEKGLGKSEAHIIGEKIEAALKQFKKIESLLSRQRK
ncbi:DUF362 domain-containing protein [Candidatus Bathyarchaeota archaeon]|nr:DUF362 domain-containing protein [Candidatus Bathyarchaeota archaeon]